MSKRVPAVLGSKNLSPSFSPAVHKYLSFCLVPGAGNGDHGLERSRKKRTCLLTQSFTIAINVLSMEGVCVET